MDKGHAAAGQALDQQVFPSVRRLREVVLLGMIADAVLYVADPDPERSPWEDGNYSIYDGNDSFGTVSFGDDCVVGACTDTTFLPQDWESRPCDWQQHFRGCPAPVLRFARETAVRRMLADFPWITTAFWSEGEYLAAAVPWDNVWERGAHVIEFETASLLGPPRTWEYTEAYSPEEVALIRSIYERKLGNLDGPLVLAPQDIAQLTAHGAAGIERCRAELAAVGIVLP